MISDQTKQKFLYDKSLVKEYKHWVVLFRYKQVTPGSMILLAKSGKLSLGDLSAEEWAEFAEVSHDVERWTREAFGAEKFNYLALMMHDPEVHFHFIPRYSKPVLVLDQEIGDPDWPSKTDMRPQDLSDDIKVEICARITAVQQGV